ncbi:unnamed protein product [Clonostachys rosea f. rosea IK726]|uniref:Cytochrome oxidase assembly n=2 Tax=Bionectria ochroleuca TaxID=29856 RepID=A0A0B7JTD0_BIOOC|nr:unnamed protein product [Clonostachys rosea f. rosea IK726]
MLSRVVRRQLAPIARTSLSTESRTAPTRCLQRRWLTPAPRPGDGPLMSRRADRELPDVAQIGFRWRRTMPIFVALIAIASAAMFNYQKSSSPVIASTMYALRTSPRAREVLGEEIYFKHQIPYIHGEMNQMKGRINIWFTVKGTRGWGTMRFVSNRPTHRGMFETSEWSLETEDGRTINLLEGGDPFKGLLTDEDDQAFEAEEASRRGFRQQGALNR